MILESLAHARLWPLVAGAAAYLAGTWAVGLRLRAAAGALDVVLSPASTVMINLSGVLASHLTFGGAAGEAARGLWLLRFTRQGRARVLAILAVDRLADGLAIVGLALCAAGSHAGMAVAVAPFVLAGISCVVLPRLVPLVGVRQLVRGAARALPAALCVWVLDLARLALVARALGLHLSLSTLAGLALAALIGGQAPTPAGVGAVEGAMVATGVALGMTPADALGLAVADRTLSLTLGTLLGALASARLGTLTRRPPCTR